jgi:hypothetical protein
MNTDKIYAEHLANEYSKKDESKVVALKKLDKKVKLPADIFTYTFGVIMALALGVGMCLSMNVIGDGSTLYFVIGIIIGLVGILGISINYPIYTAILKKRKEKYAGDIIRLAKEISDEEE